MKGLPETSRVIKCIALGSDTPIIKLHIVSAFAEEAQAGPTAPGRADRELTNLKQQLCDGHKLKPAVLSAPHGHFTEPVNQMFRWARYEGHFGGKTTRNGPHNALKAAVEGLPSTLRYGAACYAVGVLVKCNNITHAIGDIMDSILQIQELQTEAKAAHNQVWQADCNASKPPLST